MQAQFHFLQETAETQEFKIKDYVELEEAEFEKFKRNLNSEYEFLKGEYTVDENGLIQCLLVLGKGDMDGILVRTDGKRAVCTSYLSGARQILQMEKYPSLKEFADNMESYADGYIEDARNREQDGEAILKEEELPDCFEDMHFDLNLLCEMLADCKDIDYAYALGGNLGIGFNKNFLDIQLKQ